jgi:hypothetical protein
MPLPGMERKFLLMKKQANQEAVFMSMYQG